MNRPNRFVAGVVGIGMTLASTAACSGERPTGQPFDSGYGASASAGPSQPAYRSVYSNHCPGVLALTMPDLQVEYAESCLQERATGKIALIPFGDISVKTAQRLAADTTRLMTAATKGVIVPKIVVLPASPMAEQGLKEITPHICVDNRDSTTSVAGTASSVMKLDDYRIVVGLTSMPACNGNGSGAATKGDAFIDRGHRYIDIYMADKNVPTPEKTGKFSDGRTIIYEKQYDVLDVLHEELHQEGLGHANKLILVSDQKNALIQADSAPAGSKPVPFDLGAYIMAGQHQEYGEYGNVMGAAKLNPLDTSQISLKQYGLNVIQREWLRAAEYLADPSKPRHEHTMSASGISLPGKDGAAFASLGLTEPITPAQMKQGQNTFNTDFGIDTVYDGLVFVPYLDLDSQTLAGLRIYLTADKARSTLDVGQISTAHKHWIFQIGSQRVQVGFTGTNVTLTTLS